MKMVMGFSVVNILFVMSCFAFTEGDGFVAPHIIQDKNPSIVVVLEKGATPSCVAGYQEVSYFKEMAEEFDIANLYIFYTDDQGLAAANRLEKMYNLSFVKIKMDPGYWKKTGNTESGHYYILNRERVIIANLPSLNMDERFLKRLYFKILAGA
ncbi:hypothetical protein [Acanthopleuribacter pedis]|nr:hypothetical protein [Acanthopleuribacter pedis]